MSIQNYDITCYIEVVYDIWGENKRHMW